MPFTAENIKAPLGWLTVEHVRVMLNFRICATVTSLMAAGLLRFIDVSPNSRPDYRIDAASVREYLDMTPDQRREAWKESPATAPRITTAPLAGYILTLVEPAPAPCEFPPDYDHRPEYIPPYEPQVTEWPTVDDVATQRHCLPGDVRRLIHNGKLHAICAWCGRREHSVIDPVSIDRGFSGK